MNLGQPKNNALADVWYIEIQILKSLLKVCEKHGLRCFADGGTLLGAVRNQGFIPWDDDIDIVMPREDYDRFLDIGKTAFCKPIFFQSADTDVEYYRPHIQIRYDHTTAILPLEIYSAKFHQGIFIDIFPLDGVSSKQLSNHFQWIEICFWKRALDLFFNPRKRETQISYYIHKFFYQLVGKRIDIHWFQKQLRHACIRYNGSPTVTILCLNKTKDKNLLKKEWFQKAEYLPFEDILIPVPMNYDTILCIKFGKDYMIPKQEQSMHGELILDAHTDYNEIKKKYEMVDIRRNENL